MIIFCNVLNDTLCNTPLSTPQFALNSLPICYKLFSTILTIKAIQDGGVIESAGIRIQFWSFIFTLGIIKMHIHCKIRGVCKYPRQMSVFVWQSNHISAYAEPTHLIFGTVIDILSIFYNTKNLASGLCVGGDIIRLSDENRHLPRIFTKYSKILFSIGAI